MDRTSTFAVIVAITLGALLPAKHNPFIDYQAAFQANVKPAQWIPGIRDLHRFEMRIGIYEISEQNIIKKVQNAMKKSGLIPKNEIKINDNEYEIEGYYYTPSAAWLDVVTLSILIDKENNRITIDGVGESTGVVPLVVPFAPLLNIMLCFFPFDDWGNNERYLTEIRAALDLMQ